MKIGGRMGRLRFLVWSVVLAVVNIGGSYLISSVLVSNFIIAELVTFLFYIVVFIFTVFITLRRFHDLGKSGWYVLAMLVPVFDVYLLLGLLLQSGTAGPNQYGDDPLPPEKNHNDFPNHLGSNVVFKIIVTLVLCALYFVISFYVIGRQNQYAQQQEQKFAQEYANPLTTSSTNTTSSGSAPVTTSPLTTLPAATTTANSATSVPVTTHQAAPQAKASIQIVSPIQGSLWKMGEKERISWNSSGLTTVSINLINESSGDQYGIVSNTPASTGSYVGNYFWTVPSDVPPGNNYEVVVGYGATNALSSPFSITH